MEGAGNQYWSAFHQYTLRLSVRVHNRHFKVIWSENLHSVPTFLQVAAFQFINVRIVEFPYKIASFRIT